MQLPGLIRVIRIGAAALDEAEIFLAADAGADAFERRDHVHLFRLPSGYVANRPLAAGSWGFCPLFVSRQRGRFPCAVPASPLPPRRSP